MASASKEFSTIAEEILAIMKNGMDQIILKELKEIKVYVGAQFYPVIAGEFIEMLI